MDHPGWHRLFGYVHSIINTGEICSIFTAGLCFGTGISDHTLVHLFEDIKKWRPKQPPFLARGYCNIFADYD